MAVTLNSRYFLERLGLRPTYRRPCPTFIPGDNETARYPLDDSSQRVDLILDGFPPPDRGQTQNDPWPFG
jgi:hypothetical protein